MRLGTIAIILVVAALSMGARASSDELNRVGIVQALDGNYEDALRTFTRVLASDGEDFAALVNSANVYLLQGNLDGAQRLDMRARRLKSPDGGVALDLAVLYHLRGDLEQTTRFVREGLDRFEDHQEAYRVLGTLAHAFVGGNEGTSVGSAVDSSSTDWILRAALSEIPTESTQVFARGEDMDPALATVPGATRGANPSWSASRLYWVRPGGNENP